MTNTAWMQHAACRDVDPELFFPSTTEGPLYEAQVAAAKAVCARCPVRAECLTGALERLPYGVAGGLSEQERRALRSSRVDPAGPAGPSTSGGAR